MFNHCLFYYAQSREYIPVLEFIMNNLDTSTLREINVDGENGMRKFSDASCKIRQRVSP